MEKKEQEKVAVTYSWNRLAYVINQSLSSRGVKVFTGDTSWCESTRNQELENYAKIMLDHLKWQVINI